MVYLNEDTVEQAALEWLAEPLVGYDDIEASQLTCPALTTIRQPTVEKGRVAAQLLLQRIEERSLAAEHIVLPVELVERASFKALDAIR